MSAAVEVDGSVAGATAGAPAAPAQSATSGTSRPGSIPARRTVFTVVFVAVVALAWAALWIWGRSPYGRFLSHHALQGTGLSALLRLTPLFVAGWTLMTVAMMLPTSMPLVTLFHTITRNRRHPMQLVGLLVAGYLSVWTLFAVMAHLGDRGLHAVVARIGWLSVNPWVIGVVILDVAGLYQFSSLKYRCLDQCRSPFAFIAGHWRGRSDRRDAFRLGVRHGLFCLGCCWSLMLLMFAVGAGNLGWMLMLGAVMGVEKNAPWGRRIGRPLGFLLLSGAVAAAATGAVLSG